MTQFGLLMFATDYAVDPQTLAKQAEMFGFESLFLPEHTHIPASRKYLGRGKDLPKEYWHTYDPFIALGMAASVRKLKTRYWDLLGHRAGPHSYGKAGSNPRPSV